MTALWQSDGEGWNLLASAGFPDEAALHGLIEEAPQLLPLSGSPRLVILGREVQLGSNYADLIAVEPTGQLVIIEVKLARNAEARRAVVAQALTYAAFLRGQDVERLERDILMGHLRSRGYESLVDAVTEEDQERALNVDEFNEGLAHSLADGAFRLVFVLDDAPPELTRLVGYLESIGEKLVIDLVTVAKYEIGDSQLLVPQRVDPERQTFETVQRAARTRPIGEFSAGATDFVAGIERAAEADRPTLRRLADWAIELETRDLARLRTYNGQGRQTLLPWVKGEDVGLITIWNDHGSGTYISLWRTVFERRAPNSIAPVEAIIAPATIGQGNTVRAVSAELLDALQKAYIEAAGETRLGHGSFDWSLAREALLALPEGGWTTYGDLAGLVGTSAIAVGQWVANTSDVPNAWRVIGANRKPRPDFRWTNPADARDVLTVLVSEGVRFDPSGAADETQRLRMDALRQLVGDTDGSAT